MIWLHFCTLSWKNERGRERGKEEKERKKKGRKEGKKGGERLISSALYDIFPSIRSDLSSLMTNGVSSKELTL